MSVLPVLSRRRMLRWMAALAGLAVLPVRAENEKPSDRGIGGTGITADPAAGGVLPIGFQGTIQRFGSVYVNDARIAYPKGVAVSVDGRAARASVLKVGQVVRVVAEGDAAALRTGRIEVIHEVVGPIGAIEGGEMSVLGQRVLVAGLVPADGWRPGVRVAVSGIRRNDQAIVASRIEPAPAGLPDRVMGLAYFEGWNLRVGGLKLLGPGQGYAGRRIVAEGRAARGGLFVSKLRLDDWPAGIGVSRVSIEAYVERSGSELKLGSGTVFRNVPPDWSIPGAGGRAFLNIDFDASGGARLDDMRMAGSGAELRPRPGSLAPSADGMGAGPRPGGPGIGTPPAGVQMPRPGMPSLPGAGQGISNSPGPGLGR